MNRLIRERKGIASLWTVIMLMLLVAFASLVIDTGYMVVTRGELQTVADASALAGAQFVKLDQSTARNMAQSFGMYNSAANVNIQLDLNDGNAADGHIVLGIYDRHTGVFTPDLDEPNAVRVNAHRSEESNGSLQLLFMPMFGVNSTEVHASAVAMSDGGFGAGVIALDPDEPCAFDVRGTAGTLSVENGAIYVNSDDVEGACHAGRPTVESEGIYSGGDFDKGFEDKVNYDGDLYPDAEPIPDPLADLPEPPYDPADDLGAVNINGGETVTVEPGYYAGGFSVQNGTLILDPGVYILDGIGLDINGGNFIAEGVHIHVVDTTPGSGFDSRVNIRGNGIIDITPPDTETYPYAPSPDAQPYDDAQVPLFQARDNDNPSRILGTANFSLAGTMYFPSAHLEIGGTSGNFANGMIANTIEAHGDGILTIDYLGQFGLLPGSVFLVQ